MSFADLPLEIKETILLYTDLVTTGELCKASKELSHLPPMFWHKKLKVTDPNFVIHKNADPKLVIEKLWRRDRPCLGDGSCNHNAVTLSEGIGVIVTTPETQQALRDFNETEVDLGDFYQYMEFDHYHKNVILFRVVDKGVFSHWPEFTKFQSGRNRESFLMLLDAADDDVYDRAREKRYLPVYQSIVLTAFEKEIRCPPDYFEEHREAIAKLRQALLKLVESPEAIAGLWLMNSYF